MVSRMTRALLGVLFIVTSCCAIPAWARGALQEDSPQWVQFTTADRAGRTRLANLGIAIDSVRSDSVWALVRAAEVERARAAGFQILSSIQPDALFSFTTRDFPSKDARYHDYSELTDGLKKLAEQNADVSALVSIGKSAEGRDLWALHLNSSKDALASGQSAKPGVVFLGNHHAREHLSLEVPLLLAEYLLKGRGDPAIARLLETRDIWIIPMVNPDGAEYDIATDKYRWWRKNRRDNRDGSFGVDLNRNYGYRWGTGGSDAEPSSDVYMGPGPFSEPETRAVKDFVESRANLKVLLSFHTFSELVLYPWGHTEEPIADERDRATFRKMADTMVQWNKYTAEQSSELYVTSGDTTDWAYGEHRIFAFTFELSPRDMWSSGGFYPGEGMIDTAFRANLPACLYLIDLADDPYRALGTTPSPWLKNYVEPQVDAAVHWQR